MPYLDYILDKEIVTQASKQSFLVVKQILNKISRDTAQNAICFLNNFSKEGIRKANILDRISTITCAIKVVRKYQHLDTCQAKIDIMNRQIKELIELFNPLFKRSLPFLGEEKGEMWSQKEYNGGLISCRLDHGQFDDMQQDLSGKTVVDNLVGDFLIIFYFKSTCAKLDDYSYVENVELRVVAKEMTLDMHK